MRLRSLATAAAVIALAAPLTSCGFDYATERDYTPAGGANNREGVVDLLSAVVVSGAEGPAPSWPRCPTTTASTSRASPPSPPVTPALTARPSRPPSSSPSPSRPPAWSTWPSRRPTSSVTGDFAAGDFVALSFDFGNGERVSLNVPVVPDDFGYWEGMDAS